MLNCFFCYNFPLKNPFLDTIVILRSEERGNLAHYYVEFSCIDLAKEAEGALLGSRPDRVLSATAAKAPAWQQRNTPVTRAHVPAALLEAARPGLVQSFTQKQQARV